MLIDPYKTPAEATIAKTRCRRSSLIASLSGIVIWLVMIAALWFRFEPTIANGEVQISCDGVQSPDDPYLFMYYEFTASIWSVIGALAVALIVILFVCHCVAHIYRRRRPVLSPSDRAA